MQSATYLGARQVRKRYGDISDMTLWRWLHDENLDFPKPTVINKRRYFAVEDLEAFDRRNASRSADVEAARAIAEQ